MSNFLIFLIAKAAVIDPSIIAFNYNLAEKAWLEDSDENDCMANAMAIEAVYLFLIGQLETTPSWAKGSPRMENGIIRLGYVSISTLETVPVFVDQRGIIFAEW